MRWQVLFARLKVTQGRPLLQPSAILGQNKTSSLSLVYALQLSLVLSHWLAFLLRRPEHGSGCADPLIVLHNVCALVRIRSF